MILLSSSMPLRLGSFCKETLELVLHGSSATQTAQEEELKRRTQEHITRRPLDIEEDEELTQEDEELTQEDFSPPSEAGLEERSKDIASISVIDVCEEDVSELKALNDEKILHLLVREKVKT